MKYLNQHTASKHLIDEILDGDDNVIIHELIYTLIRSMSRDDLVNLFNISIEEHDIEKWTTYLQNDELQYNASIDVDAILSRGWVKYDWENLESRPQTYGKYFVMRKDGKIHWETWNGMGFAYNNNSIIYWREIKKPIIHNNDR